jgi:hypothetical protein
VTYSCATALSVSKTIAAIAHAMSPVNRDSFSTARNVMEIDLEQLKHLIRKRTDEIERCVAGTGYLAKTVIGVGTFLLDNEGNLDLLTARQRVTFEKFLAPLLTSPRQR